MEAVLTDAQKTQLKAIKASGAQGDKRGGWKQLGLTAEQKTQLKKIRESAKAQQEAVYTPEQKALMAITPLTDCWWLSKQLLLSLL